MRALMILLLALSASLVAYARPSEAAAYYPWCARYFDRSTATICGFATREQCMADVSGRGGFCLENAAAPPVRAVTAYGSFQYGSGRHIKHRHHGAHH